MAVYFIADLHLAPDTPELLALFTDFTGMLKSGDSLYILGDLFGYYIGIDPDNIAQLRVKKQIGILNKQNIPVYFIQGNRDFLLSKNDAEYFGFKLLPQRTVICISGKKCLLLHGDELFVQLWQVNNANSHGSVQCQAVVPGRLYERLHYCR